MSDPRFPYGDPNWQPNRPQPGQPQQPYPQRPYPQQPQQPQPQQPQQPYPQPQQPQQQQPYGYPQQPANTGPQPQQPQQPYDPFRREQPQRPPQRPQEFWEPDDKKRRLPGCLAVLVVLALIGAGIYFGGGKAWDFYQDHFAAAPDFPGPGTGKVTFEVEKGDVGADIGRGLKEAGIVESVDAYLEAASKDAEAAKKIQVGFYPMKKEMKAADAFEILINPKNLVAATVTIPEGLRVDDIVKRLAEETDFSRKQFQKALGQDIGLPGFANGNPEGYLFPASYDFGEKDTPKQMLTQMVDRWRDTAREVNLMQSSKDLGLKPHEVMTVASLAQNEGKSAEDMAKIARVIDNRIENPSTEGTGGRLQIDATVDYALDRPLTTGLTQAERENTDSPYNTFVEAGLPPGPISSPGLDAIEGALNPTKGDWYFYITVNLKTGETKFAETYDEFQKYEQELNEYCENESGGAC